jgi:type I pantothenate kinase
LSPVPDRYLTFERQEWAELRAATPLTLRQDDLDRLQGINERIDLAEVAEIYLPLSRLLNLYVSATQDLQRVTSTFLGSIAPKVPYVIGVAGSVAVGKSTFARILQALLSRWPDHPQVDLVTTDGFLFPNSVLTERNIMDRKGFPESYDTRSLLTFLRAVKSGEPEVAAPVYDHLAYDILPDQHVMVRCPTSSSSKGLNVLQVNREGVEFVSDYFDFSIYMDADVRDIEEWYVRRFFALRESVFRDPDSYFRHFAGLTDEQADLDRASDLGDDQRPQPPREHRAHPRAGEPRAAQVERPPRQRRPPPQAVTPLTSAGQGGEPGGQRR